MFKTETISLIVIIFLLLFSCGCGGSDVVSQDTTQDTTPLRESVPSFEWKDMTFNSITPTCAFEVVGEELCIFPYNDNDMHISMKEIFLSDNKFWDSVLRFYNNTNNIREGDGYSLVTDSNGVTYSIMKIGDESYYLISSSDLPSSYVEAVLRDLCNSNI